MTRSLFLLVLLAGLTGLAGCATPTSAPDDGLDHARMAAIQRQASAHGVKVIWINMPRKAELSKRGS